MKHKRYKGLLAAGLVLLLLLCAAGCKKEQPVTNETAASTSCSAWVEETRNENVTAQGEEHTLPMVTVG